MVLIIILVFLGVFAVAALLMMASGSNSSQEAKLVLARLDSVLAVEKTPDVSNLIVDVRKSEVVSSIPWIDRFLRQIEFVPRVRRLLAQANLKWTVGGLVLMSAAAFIFPAYLVYLRTGRLLVSLAVGAGVGFLPTAYVLKMRSMRLGKFEAGLPEALDLIVSALRVGHSFNSALGLVTRECSDPVGPEFKICYDEQNYGLELKTALENMVARVPVQDLRIVVTAILIQKESGGNLAEVLEKTATVIRERFRLKREVMTRTAQGRLTGIILTLLPVVMGFLLYMINPKFMSLLWTREIGIKLLYMGGAMLVIGGLIIRKIVNMDV